MRQLLASIAIEIPFLLLWLFFLSRANRKGRRKRAQNVMFKMVLAGAISVALAWGAYYLNPVYYIRWLGLAGYEFFVVGITEELIKFLTFVVMTRVLKSIREPQDGVLQGAAVGVGFTMVENVVYGLWYAPEVTLIRSFVVGFHVLSGALWGFAWAGAVFENTGQHQPRAYRHAYLVVFALAMLHGLNNLILQLFRSAGRQLFTFGLLELTLLLISVAGYRWMRARSPYVRYSYSNADLAIAVIRKGLCRDRHSRTLRRRLAVYLIAAGRYRDAVVEIGRLRKLGLFPPELQAFMGVALMGAHESRQGIEMLRDSVHQLSSSRRSELERELGKVVRDRWLRREMKRAFIDPVQCLDNWALRRDQLRRWNEPRVVHAPSDR